MDIYVIAIKTYLSRSHRQDDDSTYSVVGKQSTSIRCWIRRGRETGTKFSSPRSRSTYRANRHLISTSQVSNEISLNSVRSIDSVACGRRSGAQCTQNDRGT